MFLGKVLCNFVIYECYISTVDNINTIYEILYIKSILCSQDFKLPVPALYICSSHSVCFWFKIFYVLLLEIILKTHTGPGANYHITRKLCHPHTHRHAGSGA